MGWQRGAWLVLELEDSPRQAGGGLHAFLVLAHERRRIVHFAVTAHPTAEWMARQMLGAFPWDAAPRYLLRNRDRIFGRDFVKQVKAMGIKQVLSTPSSPWRLVEVSSAPSAASA